MPPRLFKLRRSRWLALALFAWVCAHLPWSGPFARVADDPPAVPNAVAVLTGHTEPVYAATFSRDQRYVVTGSFDFSVKVWEAGTGKEFKTFAGPNGHQKAVLSLGLSPDGALLASGSQ